MLLCCLSGFLVEWSVGRAGGEWDGSLSVWGFLINGVALVPRFLAGV